MLDDIVKSLVAAYCRVEDIAMTKGVDMFDYDETENSDDKAYATKRDTFHLRDRTPKFIMKFQHHKVVV